MNNTDNIPETSNTVLTDDLSSLIYKFDHYGFSYNDFEQMKETIYQEDYNISKSLNNIFLATMFIFWGLSLLGFVPRSYCAKYAFFALASSLLKILTVAWDKNHDSYLHFSSRF